MTTPHVEFVPALQLQGWRFQVSKICIFKGAKKTQNDPTAFPRPYFQLYATKDVMAHASLLWPAPCILAPAPPAAGTLQHRNVTRVPVSTSNGRRVPVVSAAKGRY